MPPAVVIVSGLPAAGKSTLAHRLSKELGFVLVERDQLGEHVLAKVADVVPPDERERIARAKDRLVNVVAAAALDAGGGVVIDGNFNVPEHAESIRSFIEGRGLPAVEICLWGDVDVLEARFIARGDPPLTDDLRPYFERVLRRERWSVLPQSAPVFHADSTDIDRLEATFDELVAAVKTALHPGG